MKLWKISQDFRSGYETYSDAVVAADTEKMARYTHPRSTAQYSVEVYETEDDDYDLSYGDWCAAPHVKVTYLGEAAPGIEAGVICASFHAG